MTAPSSPIPPSLSLGTYVQVLRRRRRLIIVIALLAAFFGVLPVLLQEPVYSSTAKVRISALDREGVFTDPGGASLPTDRFVNLHTEIEILNSKPLRAQVIASFDEPPSFEEPVVRPVGFSEVVEIRITASDPVVAADVANAYGELFVEDRRNRSVEALLVKADELRDQSAGAAAELEQIGQELLQPDLPANEVARLELRQTTLNLQILDFERRADEMAVESALRGRGTTLTEPAPLQLSPIRASPVIPGLLGLTLGLMVGLALAIVADAVQDQVAGPDDLITVRPEASLLATIPHADMDHLGGREGFAVHEAYRYLRTGVRIFGLNAELRSLLVTSAVEAEGKTTTAVHLARAMADAGDRVVLVDGDLRRPGVHEHFGLDNDRGLTSLVMSDSSIDEVTQFVRDNLAVITAGPVVQNPTEILGSEAFARVVGAIIEQADFTIIDSPPVLPVADALIAGQRVDGAVVVSRVGKVRRREVRELLRRMDEAQITLIGMVANDLADAGQYGYYGAEGADEPDARTPAHAD